MFAALFATRWQQLQTAECVCVCGEMQVVSDEVRQASPVQVTDESSQRGPVDARKTADDLLVAIQPLTLLRDL